MQESFTYYYIYDVVVLSPSPINPSLYITEDIVYCFFICFTLLYILLPIGLFAQYRPMILLLMLVKLLTRKYIDAIWTAKPIA